MTYTEPRTFFSIAGTDEQTGEIIVKVVNAGKEPVRTVVELKTGKAIAGVGKTFTLSADEPAAENSLEHPLQYIPVERNFTGLKNNFEYMFKPWSVTILRIRQE